MANNTLNAEMIVNGKVIDLFHLADYLEKTDISSIAKGLKNIIRFNGYSNYSVAEHSLVLSYITENIVRKMLTNRHYSENEGNALFGQYFSLGNVELTAKMCAYDALIHDFSESLTGDVIRPFKLLVPEVSELEDKVDAQIRAHYQTYDKMPEIVNALDKQIATIEAYYLTRNHSVTLIDVLDSRQTKAFNAVFASEIANLMANTGVYSLPTDYEEPLSEAFLDTFLRYGVNNDENVAYASLRYSIDYFKELSDSAFLSEFTHRFLSLKKSILALKKD